MVAHAAVNTLALTPNGDVLVGGAFTSAGGLPANNIALFNPASGSWTPLGAGTNDAVYALALPAGGDFLVGGEFTSAGGVVCVGIIAPAKTASNR